MKNTLRLMLAALLLPAALTIFAQQNGNIRGRVVDTDNLSLPGATVMVASVNMGTVTDNYGYFTLAGIQEGTYEITVSYIGFNAGKMPVHCCAW
jgi:hypothetical protein